MFFAIPHDLTVPAPGWGTPGQGWHPGAVFLNGLSLVYGVNAVLPGLSGLLRTNPGESIQWELNNWKQGIPIDWRTEVRPICNEETNPEMLQFLERGQQICYRAAPAIQSPHQHPVDLTATGGTYR